MSWEQTALLRRILAEEQGTITKDWGGRLPVALVYPNTYYVGMSNLGFHQVYYLLNQYQDVACERAFAPGGLVLTGQPNWEPVLPGEVQGKGRKQNKSDIDPTPVALESGRTLDQFPVIAFSVSYEGDYANVIATLRSAGIPELSAEREDNDPVVIAGGPALAGNPEPLAPVFDAIVIGEAEGVLSKMMPILQKYAGGSRSAMLRELAAIPGVYVPTLYAVDYKPDRTVASISPLLDGLPMQIHRQKVMDVNEFPTYSRIITDNTELGDMFMMEVDRGCARGCRFCLAGYTFLPQRERTLESLIEQARYGMTLRKRIGLVGAAVSDYSQIDGLADALREMGASISTSSMRTDHLSDALMRAMVEGGAKTLTIAPEAGSQRMREVINKNVSYDDIMRAAEKAANFGFKQLKMYYIVGLPTEQDEDVQAITNLTLDVKHYFDSRRTGTRVAITMSPFVPKAGTAFQWSAAEQPKITKARVQNAMRQLRKEGVDVRTDSAEWAAVQSVLARGDRRLCDVLRAMRGNNLAAWNQAMQEVGLDQNFYIYRERPLTEIQPWDIVNRAVKENNTNFENFLKKEYMRSAGAFNANRTLPVINK